jgi:flap endonuclease-1
LVGTDFNEGVKGIGAKTAVKLIRENGRLEQVLEKNKKIQLQSNYQNIRDIFLHPKVSSDYKLNWLEPNEEKVVSFLCGERDFSEDRVRKAVSKIASSFHSKSNSTLESYFG